MPYQPERRYVMRLFAQAVKEFLKNFLNFFLQLFVGVTVDGKFTMISTCYIGVTANRKFDELTALWVGQRVGQRGAGRQRAGQGPYLQYLGFCRATGCGPGP